MPDASLLPRVAGPEHLAWATAAGRVAARLTGPRRSVPVVSAGHDAVYVDLDGWALGVVGAHGTRVPCALHTRLDALPDVGDEVVVGGGAVHLPGVEVRASRLLDLRVPPLAADPAPLAAVSGPRLDEARHLLPTKGLEALRDGEPAGAPLLVGLGPGLTPLGDDVLAGWLATAVAGAHPALGPVREGVRAVASHRTTLLSATLLECAGRGEVVPPFRDLLTSLAAGEDLRRPAAALLAVGGSSGAGLLLGAQLATGGPR